MTRHWLLPLVVLAGCRARPPAPVLDLRAACLPEQRWSEGACVPRAGAPELARGTLLLTDNLADEALVELDRAGAHPLDHPRHITLWEQRAIAHAYLEREPEARAAFDMLLALDPGHVLNYTLTPRAMFLYQAARDAAAERGAPRLELRWARDQPLGRPVEVDLETVADPTGLLRAATIYVRTRGETTWKAADVPLAAPGKRERIRLPGLPGRKASALEVYAVASDPRGNEVLTWASAARPAEIALRYDPPWYRTWWVWAIAGGVVAAGTGAIVYATVWEPDAFLEGGVSID